VKAENSIKAGVSRRSVIAAGVAAAVSAPMALSAKSYSRILGANDRLNFAAMGVRSRGAALVDSCAALGHNVASLVDVDSRVLAERSGKLVSAGHDAPRTHADIRRALEDSSIDALVIATPDHWHTAAAIMALKAGKHVYVEKPCGHNGAEGEALVAAQRKYGKVVQMGNQQRSSTESAEAVGMIGEGLIGDVYQAYTWYSNNRKSIGKGVETAPPEWLDWDLWQGPAPDMPFRDNLVHYNWHWFWHWGTGETCNNAAHELDVARWAMGLGNPVQVSAKGARRFHTGDDWEMYDTLRLTLAYEGGREIIWDGHSCNEVKKFGRTRGVLLYGTKGSAIVDREGYVFSDLAGEVIAERIVPTDAADSGNLVGGGRLTDLHIANFVDAVRGKSVLRSPIDEGATSTLMCHLGNTAYRVGRELQIDPQTGRPQDAEAMTYWGREYRPGWELAV
jgi:predicted dehydrogenase